MFPGSLSTSGVCLDWPVVSTVSTYFYAGSNGVLAMATSD
jgi:hypothetical protein